jgi:hypothetical protein
MPKSSDAATTTYETTAHEEAPLLPLRRATSTSSNATAPVGAKNHQERAAIPLDERVDDGGAMPASNDPPPTMSTLASGGDDDDDEDNDDQWDRAMRLLQDSPDLITAPLFLLALRHRAPAAMVRLMLLHSPHLASVPAERIRATSSTTTPTATNGGGGGARRTGAVPPLHLALACGCNADVVRLLVEADPSALQVQAPFPPAFALPKKEDDDDSKEDDHGGDNDLEGELLDPLAYVQKHRPHDAELIALLRDSRTTAGAATAAVVMASASSHGEPAKLDDGADDDDDIRSVAASASDLTRPARNRRHGRTAARQLVGGAVDAAMGRTPTVPTTGRTVSPSTSSSSSSASSSSLSLLNLCVSGTTTLVHEDVLNSPETTPDTSMRGTDGRTFAAPSAVNGSGPLRHKGHRPAIVCDEIAMRAKLNPEQQPLPAHQPNLPHHPPLLSQSNEEELVNVKRLCAAVVRGHRKLSKRMDDLTRSVVESTVASEERVMHVLLSELAHRDGALSASMSGWHESVSRQIQESARRGLEDVLAETTKREGELLRRLAALEQHVHKYATFRSFEMDPPPLVRQRNGKELWMDPTGTSGASRRTAATFPTSDQEGSSSFDDSWTCDFASSSFCHFDLVDKEEDFSAEHSLLAWTFDYEKGGNGAGLMGRCVYEGDADDECPDETRSLLGGLGFPRVHFRSTGTTPSMSRRQVWINLGPLRARNPRPRHYPYSCPLWPPLFHRWLTPSRSGRTHFETTADA